MTRLFALPRWFVAPATVFAAVLMLATHAFAQNVGSMGTGFLAEQQKMLSDHATRADELERHIQANAEDDTRLLEIRGELDRLADDVLKTSLAFRPRLAEINARLDQLGPAPGAGQPAEPDIIALERAGLVAEKAEINALLGVAENLTIRINGLLDRIAQLRREIFASLLTKRYEINYALIGEVLDEFSGETVKFWRSVAAWIGFVVQFKLPSVLTATFFALLAASILLIGGRRVFGRLIVPDPAVASPSYLSRLSVAFWSTLLPSAALLVFVAATSFFYEYFGVLRGDIGAYLNSFFAVIVLVYFVDRLGRAVLSPNVPSWRLVGVETGPAKTLSWLIFATAFVTGADFFLSSVYEVMGSSLSLTVGESLVATVIVGVLVIMISLVKPFVDEAGKPRPWHPVIRYALRMLGIATIVVALLGYIGLAKFVSAQIVLTGAILVTMYIGALSARAIAEEGAFAGTTLGRRLQRWFSLDDTTLDQLSLVVSIMINLVVLSFGLPLILLQWGFAAVDIQSWVYRFASDFRIGSVSFSLIGVLTGLLVFVVGFVLTRWFQGWLDGSVMARGRVDTGVRNSIRTVVGYLGLAIAALIGVSAAGVDLSNLALIAGGLSLGIGFGLQNIVQNFVSGLILLAERPFKAGDWIVAGPVSGTVKKISVRATEIETFQRQTVILPNSELINAAVGNWTHRNRLGRFDVKVNVAYGQDIQRAHAIMTEIARAHPMVLKNPEPFVLFVNSSPIAHEFEMRVFLADIFNQNIVQNDFRFAVLDAFKEAGIEMPSNPRWVDPATAPSTAVSPATAPEPVAERPKRRKKPDPDGE